MGGPQLTALEALNQAIDAADELVEAEYTTATWTDLESAITAGEAVVADSESTLSEVIAATTAITDAIYALVPEQVATPVADPAAGAVADNSTVAITCSTVGALIYYTVDGSTPTSESTLYETAITITDAVTINAIAYKGVMTASAVLSAAYTIA